MSPTASNPQIIKPLDRVDLSGTKSVFLSGSIDQDAATSWQVQLQAALGHHPGIAIINPHRPDWDASWTQDISSAPFREQVEWELDMLERADVIAVYFSPASQAPVTLLELGLFARSGKVVVACPEGFWKRGNVQVVCERWGIPLVDDLDALRREVERRLVERE
ncbi:hypothetical protein D9619_010268 [Psilocybe cf. subviscida]|uniref:Uncharacterized protein n=1 Tax=Psilocybe cf. subviscida TaxID=2480587 RepID=A0A8H5ERQ5_9AGAR|nr:hypothetical protein D9619_010268 [Psilocybe cf. subviscida]